MVAGVCALFQTENRLSRKIHKQRVTNQSKEARDAVNASGMEYGAGLSFDRLEEMVIMK
jgi:hypothetical protein